MSNVTTSLFELKLLDLMISFLFIIQLSCHQIYKINVTMNCPKLHTAKKLGLWTFIPFTNIPHFIKKDSLQVLYSMKIRMNRIRAGLEYFFIYFDECGVCIADRRKGMQLPKVKITQVRVSHPYIFAMVVEVEANCCLLV